MPAMRVTFDPLFSRAVKYVFLVVLLAVLGAVVVRYSRREGGSSRQGVRAQNDVVSSLDNTERVAHEDLFIPSMGLCLSPSDPESMWIREMGARLGCATEVEVPHGRADLLCEEFAVEIDRLEKWHESIGQSLHYAGATNRSPCVALIIPTAERDGVGRSLLIEIDRTCREHGIKLVLLRSQC